MHEFLQEKVVVMYAWREFETSVELQEPYFAWRDMPQSMYSRKNDIEAFEIGGVVSRTVNSSKAR